jgi:hypothetical protein
MDAKIRNTKVSEALKLVKETFSNYRGPDDLSSFPGTSNSPYVACLYWKKSDQKGLEANTAE